MEKDRAYGGKDKKKGISDIKGPIKKAKKNDEKICDKKKKD